VGGGEHPPPPAAEPPVPALAEMSNDELRSFFEKAGHADVASKVSEDGEATASSRELMLSAVVPCSRAGPRSQHKCW
jgi:hypothetical protein